MSSRLAPISAEAEARLVEASAVLKVLHRCFSCGLFPPGNVRACVRSSATQPPRPSSPATMRLASPGVRVIRHPPQNTKLSQLSHQQRPLALPQKPRTSSCCPVRALPRVRFGTPCAAVAGVHAGQWCLLVGVCASSSGQAAKPCIMHAPTHSQTRLRLYGAGTLLLPSAYSQLACTRPRSHAHTQAHTRARKHMHTHARHLPWLLHTPMHAGLPIQTSSS